MGGGPGSAPGRLLPGKGRPFTAFAAMSDSLILGERESMDISELLYCIADLQARALQFMIVSTRSLFLDFGEYQYVS